VSTHGPAGGLSAGEPPPPSQPPVPALAGRLGYLLKHAQLRMAEFNAAALAPFGITGRELAVLLAIDSQAPLSQQEAAGRLGVDRTTMVALIDELEGKQLVQRRQDPADRRKNVVALTPAGRATLRKAGTASDEAERRLLAPLTGDQAAQVREALRMIAFPSVTEPAAIERAG
jgi:DNA-binding MarR family transcriptional regulator